jgi:hypothetical protein
MMDGKPKTFSVEQSFFEITLDPTSKGPKDGIEISDGSGKKEGFQFEFKKSGTTKIKGNVGGDMNCIINYYNPQGITYTGDGIIVIVTSYDQKRLTASFSGKIINIHADRGSEKYPAFIMITDGKIDLHR